MNIISMFKFWQIYSYSVATQIWRICAIIKDTSDHLSTIYKKQDTPNKIFFSWHKFLQFSIHRHYILDYHLQLT